MIGYRDSTSGCERRKKEKGKRKSENVAASHHELMEKSPLQRKKQFSLY